ncbi:hypothetical protein [Falsiroseomonas ponticola]|uniref:hypothetical protein n=1 Tax=Falsiroseomonas ponticola TaxID=2786951 RepID=UPI0019321AA2|nr:hypothetical protein [Roseomonas ponticola]
MIASRSGLVLHAVTLLAVLAIGTTLGIGFAVPLSQGLSARIERVRGLMDQAALPLTQPPGHGWHR